MTGHPTFCAIMPNYNDAASLPRAIESLAQQTVPFDRILVVNDGSTDDSMAILSGIKQHMPCLEVLDNDRNIGIIASANRGLAYVTEDYVFFVSANDYFELDMLARARQSIADSSTDIGLIGGQTRLLDQQTGQEILITAPLPDLPKIYDAAAYRSIIRTRNFSFFGGSTFVHRLHCLAAGGLRQEMKWHADWFLFALLATRYGFAYVPAIIGTMTVSPNQYSNAIHDWSQQSVVIGDFITLLRRDYPEDYRVFKAIGLLPSYDLPALWKLIRDPQLRDYLTVLLVWRLLVYKAARVLGRLINRRLRERLRGLLRV